MVRVLVGSRNPVKIDVCKNVFSQYFNDVKVEGLKVSSEVRHTPYGDDVIRGARNRVKRLVRIDEERECGTDYFVGIEGGITQYDGTWMAYGGVHVQNSFGLKSSAPSSCLPLPQEVMKLVFDGEELGNIVGRLVGDEDAKRKGGAVGYLTNGVVDRQELYRHGLVMALVPFIKSAFYGEVR